MEYLPVHTKSEMVEVFSRESLKGKDNMFVEGLVYSENSAVIMLGNITDNAEPGKVKFNFFWYNPNHITVFQLGFKGIGTQLHKRDT